MKLILSSLFILRVFYNKCLLVVIVIFEILILGGVIYLKFFT